jgi:hypothetical protein
MILKGLRGKNCGSPFSIATGGATRKKAMGCDFFQEVW